jgi:hypothetical protein
VQQLPLLWLPVMRRPHIERGRYTHAVVRWRFEASSGRQSYVDSRVLCRSWAVILANWSASNGATCEVLGVRDGIVRPADWQLHKTKRLDVHRLNRVAGLISADSMYSAQTVMMGDELDDDS